ncbi:MAG: SANT/Myb domain-containing protein [Parachlamydiaceae bacterium]|nr:SANT/Myb domain-containing protein [Parachlamydiaceae bacterium]
MTSIPALTHYSSSTHFIGAGLGTLPVEHINCPSGNGWTQIDTNLLIAGVKIHKDNWFLITSFVKGKSIEQCKARYAEVVKYFQDINKTKTVADSALKRSRVVADIPTAGESPAKRQRTKGPSSSSKEVLPTQSDDDNSSQGSSEASTQTQSEIPAQNIQFNGSSHPSPVDVYQQPSAQSAPLLPAPALLPTPALILPFGMQYTPQQSTYMFGDQLKQQVNEFADLFNLQQAQQRQQQFKTPLQPQQPKRIARQSQRMSQRQLQQIKQESAQELTQQEKSKRDPKPNSKHQFRQLQELQQPQLQSGKPRKQVSKQPKLLLPPSEPTAGAGVKDETTTATPEYRDLSPSSSSMPALQSAKGEESSSDSSSQASTEIERSASPVQSVSSPSSAASTDIVLQQAQQVLASSSTTVEAGASVVQAVERRYRDFTTAEKIQFLEENFIDNTRVQTAADVSIRIPVIDFARKTKLHDKTILDKDVYGLLLFEKEFLHRVFQKEERFHTRDPLIEYLELREKINISKSVL